MSDFRVVALIAVYNEEDIIEACLEHLHAQGIQSYLLDDGSTDGTVVRASAFRERGLLGIESLPATNPPTFSLRRILARKEVLAGQLEADWFINQDADEFRDSLWPEYTLREALVRVDRRGFNAVDFEIFTIRPVGAPEHARAHPDAPGQMFAPPGDFDRLQVRAWKRGPGGIDLQSTAGHDVTFPGRRVFPLRFPMRHYPIRSQAHGERKLFAERLPRFSPDERAHGWHVQYAGAQRGASLVAATAEMRPFDLSEARLDATLKHRDLEGLNDRIRAQNESIDALDRQAQAQVETIERQRREIDGLGTELAGEVARHQADAQRAVEATQSLEQQLAAAVIERDVLARDVAAAQALATRDLAAAQALASRLTEDVAHLQRELDGVYRSRSWRWSGPLRAMLRLLAGEGAPGR